MSTRKHHSHTQTITRASSEVGSMSDDEGQHKRRTKWTNKMCIDLQLCKRKALDLHNSDDCPKKPNGRKEGVMNITLRFWNDLGYEYLGKTAQNLPDKLGHLEKITKARSTQTRPETEIQQEQQRETISRSGKNNQIANSDDLDNYERNTQETIEITALLQEGINECTPEQENPGIPINVPTEDEQFYVDVRNIAQPTFNLFGKSQWGTGITETVLHLQGKFRMPDKLKH